MKETGVINLMPFTFSDVQGFFTPKPTDGYHRAGFTDRAYQSGKRRKS